MFFRITFFRDSASQLSLEGLPGNLHTSLVTGQTLKPTFEKIPPPPRNLCYLGDYGGL